MNKRLYKLPDESYIDLSKVCFITDARHYNGASYPHDLHCFDVHFVGSGELLVIDTYTSLKETKRNLVRVWGSYLENQNAFV